MKHYRIREERIEDLDTFWNTPGLTEPIYHIIYHVQVRVLRLFWLTIRTYDDPDPWWSKSLALNLIDSLNAE